MNQKLDPAKLLSHQPCPLTRPGGLGQGKWDVIHFNWGLHDLIIQADGDHRVPLGQYERNLQELVQRLKATEATLIWASTTPVPERIEGGGPLRRNADAIAYNAVARKIMEEHQIQDAAKESVPITKMEAPNDHGQNRKQCPLRASSGDKRYRQRYGRIKNGQPASP